MNHICIKTTAGNMFVFRIEELLNVDIVSDEGDTLLIKVSLVEKESRIEVTKDSWMRLCDKLGCI